MLKFEPKPELLKKNQDSKVFVCTQCGECCHIREEKKLTEKEEETYKSFMYKHFGIIYLANLSDITINIWPEERVILEQTAKNKSKSIIIRPKRAVYNAKTNNLIILDYFLHNIFSFLNNNFQ